MPDQNPRRPWLPYVAPMLVFLVLTSLESLLPKGEDGDPAPRAFMAAYVSKIVLVTVTAWLCRSTWRDLGLRIRGQHVRKAGSAAGTWAASVLLGLLVYAAWVGLHGRYPDIPLLGGRSGFDPAGLDGGWRILFLAARFYGLVLVVPLIEEIFWRSFLMRWISAADFTKLPVGTVTLKGAVVSTLLFALAHPEWLPALLTGIAWTLLLMRTRSLAACWISHVVANLALGIHVMATGSWWFW